MLLRLQETSELVQTGKPPGAEAFPRGDPKGRFPGELEYFGAVAHY